MATRSFQGERPNLRSRSRVLTIRVVGALALAGVAGLGLGVGAASADTVAAGHGDAVRTGGAHVHPLGGLWGGV